MMMLAAAQQPGAGDIHREAEAGDRDRLGEVDRHRREQAGDGLVADQQRDHRQDDRAGEAGEIAELAGAEGEARIVRRAARIGIGERREQQRAGMRAHVQAVGDEGDRAEQQAADDLGDHHGAAEPDHRPGLAFALFVPLAEEHVACDAKARAAGCRSCRASFQIGADDFEQLLGRLGVERVGVAIRRRRDGCAHGPRRLPP